MLIFDKILFKLCSGADLNFLAFRMYTGFWCALMLLVIVFMRWSRYVSLITMFTEECFACLISLIFIIDGMKKIINSMNVYRML